VKKLILSSCFLAQSLIGQTPNVADGTPAGVTYEQDAIALTLIGEAGGEGQLGIRLVADVIHERMKRRKLTPFEVVSQPKQFAGFMNGERDHPQYVFCLMMAILLEEGHDPMPELTFDQFRAISSPIPGWAIKPIIFKGHVFFEEPTN